MKQNSSASRTRKQVHTQREEVPASTMQLQDRPRGVSSNSASVKQKQSTPIKLLQAKHKHLEVQLAKLSAEVALQKNENENPQRSSSNLDLHHDTTEGEQFSSPTNLHVNAGFQDQFQSPSIQIVHERSGSNNSAKKKKVIKMQSIQQNANGSQKALMNVHIPGSDMSGKPLASYMIPNTDERIFSPGMRGKVKIEKKKINPNAARQPSLFDFNPHNLAAQPRVQSSKPMAAFSKGNAPPKATLQVKKSQSTITRPEPLKAYFYQAQKNEEVQASQRVENVPDSLAIEMPRPRANSKQPTSTTPSSIHIPTSAQPATTRYFPGEGIQQTSLMSPEIQRASFATGLRTVSHEPDTSGSILEVDSGQDLFVLLENGIMNLHNNLKGLEGRYIDLANFYKSKLLISITQSPEKLKPASHRLPLDDEGLERSKIDAVKTEKLRLEAQMKSLILLQNRLQDEVPRKIDQRVRVIVQQAQLQTLEQFDQGLLTKGTIKTTFGQLGQSLQSLMPSHHSPTTTTSDEIDKVINEFELQHEYSMSNIQEAMFQLTNTNDKIKLDLKKIGLIINEMNKHSSDQENDIPKLVNQLNLGFAQIHAKAVRNEKQYKQLESLTKESLVAIHKLRLQIKEVPSADIVTRLHSENEQLKNQCQYYQTAFDGLEKQKVIETQTLEDQVRTLVEQNSALLSDLDKLRLPVPQLKVSATHRPHHPSQPSLTSGDTDDWQRSCSCLADHVSKFLHSMRRLQKVVHKKEANVQKEKQDFEQCKKDLEAYLKQVKSSIEAQPVSELDSKSERDVVKPLHSMRVVSTTEPLTSIPGDSAKMEQLDQLQSENTDLAKRLSKEKKRVLALISELKSIQEISDQQLRVSEGTKQDLAHQLESLKSQLASKSEQKDQETKQLKFDLAANIRQVQQMVSNQIQNHAKSHLENFIEPTFKVLEKRFQQIEDMTNKLNLARTMLNYKSQSKLTKLNRTAREQDHLLQLNQAADKASKLEKELQHVKQQSYKDSELRQRSFQKTLEKTEAQQKQKISLMEGLVASLKEQLDKQAPDMQALVAQHTAEIGQRNEQVHQLETQVQRYQSKAKEAKLAADQITTQIQMMQQQHEKALTEKDQLYAELDTRSKHRMTELQSSLLAHQQQLDELQGEQDMLHLQLDEATKRVKQLENQVAMANQTVGEKESELLHLKTEMAGREKDREKANKTQSLEMSQQIEQAALKIEARDEELAGLRAELNEREQELRSTKASADELQQIVAWEKRRVAKMESKLAQSNTEIQSLKDERESCFNEIEILTGKLQSTNEKNARLENELRREREQMRLIVNESGEQQSKEMQLSLQLSKTQETLRAKEEACEQLRCKIDQLNADREKLEQTACQLQVEAEEYQKKIVQLEQSQNLSTQQAESQLATLESNRVLIGKLKTELQKQIERAKVAESSHQQIQIDVDRQSTELNELGSKLRRKEEELADLSSRLEQSQSEVQSASLAQTSNQEHLADMRIVFEQKLQQVQRELQSKQTETEQQRDLLEEANVLLNQFNEEKHEIKAKFKYLMQLIELPNLSESLLDAQSSYKGRDDEVDLIACFEEVERLVVDFKTSRENRITELMSDSALQADKISDLEDKLQTLQAQLCELNKVLAQVESSHEANNKEMKSQLEIAQRKINNYKDKILEKVDQIRRLELELAQKSAPHIHIDNDSLAESFTSVQKENIELLQKLQKAELELAQLRERDLSLSDISTPAFKEVGRIQTTDPDKVADLDKKLFAMKKQLQCAKEECIKALCDFVGVQNQDNAARFNKTEILKKALQKDKVTGWNNKVKECKRVEFGGRTFLLVEVKDTQEFYVVDKQELSDAAYKYLLSYVEGPDSLVEEEISLDQVEEVQKLKSLISDLRQDRLLLQQELDQFRDEPYTATKPDLKLKTMQDDIEFFTSENLELQSKVKEVCMHNAQLKLQIVEMTKRPEMLRDSLQELNEIDVHQVQLQPQAMTHELEDVLTARNEIENESAMFEVAKNSQELIPQEDGTYTGDYNNDDDFVSEGSFREVMQDIERHTEASGKKELNELDLLRSQLQEAERKLKVQAELLDKHEEHGDASTVIAHIKGTLIQFMKNLPLTEPKNEELLKIIYSMMEFSPTEVSELYNQRASLKVNTKTRARNPSTQGTGTNLSSDNTGNISQEKPKKALGWFGFGAKKDTNTSAGPQAPSPQPQRRK